MSEMLNLSFATPKKIENQVERIKTWEPKTRD